LGPPYRYSFLTAWRFRSRYYPFFGEMTEAARRIMGFGRVQP
jgi:hypothetical protein